MVRPALKQARRLQRRDAPPLDAQTDDRDAAADWIEAHVVDGERDWRQWTLTEMAEESGWSRQHMANTLDAYFDPAGSPQPALGDLADELVDADHSGEGYRAGLRDGFTEGVKFALENEAVLRRLADDAG